MYICKPNIEFYFTRFNDKTIINITLYHSQIDNITPINFPLILMQIQKNTKLLNKPGKSPGYIDEQIQ